MSEDIRIEQCIRYLLKHENHFTMSQSNSGVLILSACMSTDGKRLGDGPTPLEALLAACETCRQRA